MARPHAAPRPKPSAEFGLDAVDPLLQLATGGSASPAGVRLSHEPPPTPPPASSVAENVAALTQLLRQLNLEKYCSACEREELELPARPLVSHEAAQRWGGEQTKVA